MNRFSRVESELRSAYAELSPDDMQEYEKANDIPFDVEKAGSRARKLKAVPSSGNEMLDRLVAASGVDLRFGTDSPGTTVSGEFKRGAPMPNNRSATWVVMPNIESFRTPEAYREILAHELVHWSKVLPESTRRVVGWSEIEMALGIVPEGYAEEEMTAEIGAALILEAIGDDPKVRDRALYMKGWAASMRSDEERSAAYASAIKAGETAAAALLKLAGVTP